jgi:hypothetical protein
LLKGDLKAKERPSANNILIHFHKLKQHDVSIRLPFITTLRIDMTIGLKPCCIAFGNVRFLFGKSWEKWGIPRHARTTDVSGAIFNALLLATHCF